VDVRATGKSKKTGYGSVAKRWTLIQWLTTIVASSSSSSAAAAAANTSYR